MNRISELEELIPRYSKAYYSGKPEIDDASFDALVDELGRLDPNHPLLFKVGSEPPSPGAKIQHLMPMGSQQKARNLEEFNQWATKYPGPWIVNHKLDGLSVELQYQNGDLVSCSTRGNGKVGSDVSVALSNAQGVPSRIPDFTGSVRGEIVIPIETFDEVFRDSGFRNPRNLAVGMAKKPGPQNEHLYVVVYDIYCELTPFSDERSKIEFLQEYFDYVAETKLCKTQKSISKWYQELIQAREAKNLEFEIDGLVIKCLESDPEDMQRDRPMRQIALKFPPLAVHTHIRSIEWTTHGSVYTPVAIFDPVDISGSMVSRASIHNPGILAELGLRVGSVITVVKRGDIIPKIESVVEIGSGKRFGIPKECVYCQGALKLTDTKLFCPNDMCGSRLLHQIRKWISVLEVKFFGEKLIEAVYNSGLVEALPDLYTLKTSDLEDLNTGSKRVGHANAQKALANLHAVEEVSLAKFIAGYDIPGLGEKTIQLVVDAGYDTLEKLHTATIDQLCQIRGIGQTRAETLVYAMEFLREEFSEMTTHIQIQEPVVPDPSPKPLSGVSVCFTGRLQMPRKQAEDLVVSKGGIVKANVGRGLTYLVTPDPGSGTKKNQDALKYGTQILDEDQFLELFDS